MIPWDLLSCEKLLVHNEKVETMIGKNNHKLYAIT